jgi:hypothetical protein
MDELKIAFHKVYDLGDQGEESERPHFLATFEVGDQSNYIAYSRFDDMYNSLQPENIEGTLKENLPENDYKEAMRIIRESNKYKLNKNLIDAHMH